MDVLLTGATGFIGSHLRWRLSHTHRVYALARQDAPPKESGITWIRADLTRPELMLSLPSRVDAIVAMAQSRDYREPNENRRDIFEVNIRSSRSLPSRRLKGLKRAYPSPFANTETREPSIGKTSSSLQQSTYVPRRREQPDPHC